MSRLYLHQELLLLTLNDSKGTFEGGMYLYGVAGAVLSELLLQGRIKTSEDDKQIVTIAENSPTGDEILDEVVQLIRESAKPRPLKHWVSKVANIRELKHQIAEQLCKKGVLQKDEKKILWLFTQRIYPEANSSVEDEIRQRMGELMFQPDQKGDERTTVLVAFAKCSNVLNANFAKVELQQHRNRIEEISKGDLLATQATQATIASVQAAITAATVATTIAATTAATAN